VISGLDSPRQCPAAFTQFVKRPLWQGSEAVRIDYDSGQLDPDLVAAAAVGGRSFSSSDVPDYEPGGTGCSSSANEGGVETGKIEQSEPDRILDCLTSAPLGQI